MLIITLILIKRWVGESGSHILLHGSACSHCSVGCVSPHWPTFRSQGPLARQIWCPSIDHFRHWNLLSWLLRLDSLLAFSPPHKLLRSFHTASAPWSSHPACGWLYLTARVPCFYRPPRGGTLVSSRSRHGFSCLVGPPWCDDSGTWDCGHPASEFTVFLFPPGLTACSIWIGIIDLFTKANTLDLNLLLTFSRVYCNHPVISLPAFCLAPLPAVSAFRPEWSFWKARLLVEFACTMSFNGSLWLPTPWFYHRISTTWHTVHQTPLLHSSHSVLALPFTVQCGHLKRVDPTELRFCLITVSTHRNVVKLKEIAHVKWSEWYLVHSTSKCWW